MRSPVAVKTAYMVRLRRAEAAAKRISERTMQQQPWDYPRMMRAVNRYLRLCQHHDQMALTHVSGFQS
jgi:hypothetical protein